MYLAGVEVHQLVNVPPEQYDDKFNHELDRTGLGLDRGVDLGQELPLNEL